MKNFNELSDFSTSEINELIGLARRLDGPSSASITEARDRTLVQMAVLHQMLSGS